MKTTIDIADALLQQARLHAREQDRTLRDLVEEALRRFLTEEQEHQPFRLNRRHSGGQGLQPGIREGDWDTIRGLIYPM